MTYAATSKNRADEKNNNGRVSVTHEWLTIGGPRAYLKFSITVLASKVS